MEIMQVKHTHGPWFVDHKSPFLVRAGNDIDGRHIAHIGPANYTPRFDVDAPNAALIAAAPDLLDALEQFVAWVDAPCESAFSDSQLASARAAIAKAKGEWK